MRDRLPSERTSIVRKFKIKYINEADGQASELKFYLTTSMYPDGRLGEVFVAGDKVGSLLSGTLDAMAMVISVALQHGVPLQDITSKLRNHKFGPAGFTGDKDFPSCTSMFDLIARYLDSRFPEGKLVAIERG